jgi:oligopeptide/dipeptide ABC transporter ATP-binding protein
VSLLEVRDLRIEFGDQTSPLLAVRDVGFDINEGEVVGLVGGSGSGKSLTSRAIMRLIAYPGRISAGSIVFDGRDVLAMSNQELREFRARQVGMIFQDPFNSLNPVHQVGAQLSETLKLNLGLKHKSCRTTAIEMLSDVGLDDPERQYSAYPHQLSGGMRQRVMIALATAARPRLLLADEPTTALDVITQKQILQLLTKMRRELGMGMLLVSHDFGVIAQMCDRVLVMYAGHILEAGPIEALYDAPQHPYTRALMEAIPELDADHRSRERQPLPGRPPEITERPQGCVLRTRCPSERPECAEVTMRLKPVGAGGHVTACPFVNHTAKRPSSSLAEAP